MEAPVRPNEKTPLRFPVAWLAVCALLVAFPLLSNFKRHDNHMDRTNHNYGLNMLMSVEPHSYLMTEGGDNQVFALAYLTMVEKMRPDLTIHDQKGNVFINPYGDMARMTAEMLEDAKTRANAKIIESGRPVYLTWRWREIYKCGPYYYRQYGIMYKVQPIRYYVVDVLKHFEVLTLDEALRLCNRQLGEPQYYISMAFLEREVGKLEREGLVRTGVARNGGGRAVQFVKDYAEPFPGENLWEHYIFDWNVPNARYWDYLMREIIVNYNFQRGDIYRDVAGLHQSQARVEQEQGRSAARSIALMNEDDAKAMECYKRSKDFGYDMTAIHYNLAILFEQQGDVEAALSNYRKSIEVDEELYQAYDRIANIRLGQSRQPGITEVQREEYLRDAEETILAGQDVAAYYRTRYDNGARFLEEIRGEGGIEEQQRRAAADPTGGEDVKLGNLLETLGRDPDALQAYASAMRKSPGYWFSYFRAFQCLDRLGRRDEALAMLVKARDAKMKTVNLDSLRLQLHLAMYLDQMGRRQEAVAEYRRFLAAVRGSGHGVDLVRETKQATERLQALEGGS
jgi:tetratricopeptide (TPR) repeat protein